MHELQQLLLTDPTNQRDVPEWGKAIFSPLCVCMTPKVRARMYMGEEGRGGEGGMEMTVLGCFKDGWADQCVSRGA